MTLCLLVRHAAHELLDRVLVGRRNGVPISEAGHGQVREIVQKLPWLRIARIQSSPRDRALQTAMPIGERAGLAVETCDALDEVDFGSWSGRRFEELACDWNWRYWNEKRHLGRAPGGERMADVQARIVAHLRRTHAQLPRARILMVSHAEVIRAAVLHCRRLPLDAWPSIDVPPASITAVQTRSRRHSLVSIEQLIAA